MNRNSTDLFTFVTKKQDLDVLRQASIKRRDPASSDPSPQPSPTLAPPKAKPRISNSTALPQGGSLGVSKARSSASLHSLESNRSAATGQAPRATGSVSLHDFEHKLSLHDSADPPAPHPRSRQACTAQGCEASAAKGLSRCGSGLSTSSSTSQSSLNVRSKLHLVSSSPDLSSDDDDNGFIAFIPTHKMGNSSVSTLQTDKPSLKSVLSRRSRLSSASSSKSALVTPPTSSTALTSQPPLPNKKPMESQSFVAKGPHRRTEGGHMMWDGLTTVSDSSSKLSLSRQTSNTSVATARSANSARSTHSDRSVHSRQSQKPAKRKSYKPVTKKSAENSYYNYFTEFLNNSKESDSLIYAATRREAWIQYQQSAFEGYQSDIAELWGMMALRFILHGALLFSPGALALKSSPDTKNVLEFQGITKEQWSWQLAFDFPDAMVYGYEWQLGTVPQSRGGGGPANYIQVTGKSLDKLPFSDNYFDIISAKCLWYLIQSDQWVPLFKELRRVLKPGGYIETLICDFAQINPNPLEEKYWSRLTNALRARRMHIEPSQHVASHLNAAGFHNIHRAYTALPRAWGGRVGDLTDLLTMFFSTTLMIHFGNLNTEERKDYCRLMADRGSGAKINTAYKFMACYAQKPE
ncbi:hypothetical protein CJU89_6786 [Yarrowia sp. B02]|nr:hypothetical protein CJU89_6786 [Yarrowia sp. B02]